MAMKSRPTMMKRARERARAEKQKEKTMRRLERGQQVTDRPTLDGGSDGDPDIAHIQAGPQPLAEWQMDPEEQTSDDEAAESESESESEA